MTKSEEKNRLQRILSLYSPFLESDRRVVIAILGLITWLITPLPELKDAQKLAGRL